MLVHLSVDKQVYLVQINDLFYSFYNDCLLRFCHSLIERIIERGEIMREKKKSKNESKKREKENK